MEKKKLPIFAVPRLEQTTFESNQDLVEYVMNEIYPDIDTLDRFIEELGRTSETSVYPTWLSSKCTLEPTKDEFVGIIDYLAEYKKKESKKRVMRNLFTSITAAAVTVTMYTQKHEIKKLKKALSER